VISKNLVLEENEIKIIEARIVKNLKGINPIFFIRLKYSISPKIARRIIEILKTNPPIKTIERNITPPIIPDKILIIKLF
jgi:hypothetical protein